MRHLRLLPLLLAALLLGNVARAEARPFDAGELESLAAPIALYPNEVVIRVLGAAGDPLRRDALPYPELRARMQESPYWTQDLAFAYATQERELWHAIAILRHRAAAQGHPLAEVPYVAPQGYVVPYYDPLVVYGPWPWPHRPHGWRPWGAPPVVVSAAPFFAAPPVALVVAPPARAQQHQQHQHHHRHHRPSTHVHHHHHHHPQHVQAAPRAIVPPANPPSPAAQMQNAQSAAFLARAQAANQPSPAAKLQAVRPIPEAQRQPIVQQHYQTHRHHHHGHGPHGAHGGRSHRKP